MEIQNMTNFVCTSETAEEKDTAMVRVSFEQICERL